MDLRSESLVIPHLTTSGAIDVALGDDHVRAPPAAPNLKHGALLPHRGVHKRRVPDEARTDTLEGGGAPR